MAKKIKIGLFILLLGVLWLPLLQKNIPFIDGGGKLGGYYVAAPDVDATWKTWFNGDFQQQKNKFYNDHVGFRPFLLKLHSQMNYSLFQKLDYGGTTLGSNNYLFYDNYIDAYNGKDFVGQAPLREKIRKIKALQDTLARQGKTLIVVYAPCKAWFYPEYFPRWKKMPRNDSNNNYKTLVRIGDSAGINQTDINRWYLSLKDTNREALYPKLGIHWSNYGSILGADTIIRYIERLRQIKMPHPKWTKVIHTTEARQPDNDMANTLNLFFPLAKETYCYPELYYTNDSGITKPKLIFVGDSYTINLIRTGVLNNISKEWQFWFGFKNVMNKDNYDAWEYIKMENYNWKGELDKADCIIILNTPMNMNNLGNGFVEAAYDYYYPAK